MQKSGQHQPITLRLSARVLGMFSHTTCSPIAFGSWTSQQMPRLRLRNEVRLSLREIELSDSLTFARRLRSFKRGSLLTLERR